LDKLRPATRGAKQATGLSASEITKKMFTTNLPARDDATPTFVKETGAYVGQDGDESVRPVKPSDQIPLIEISTGSLIR